MSIELSFLRLAAVGLAVVMPFVGFTQPARAEQTLAEKRCWGNVRATDDERTDACSELIRREASERRPNELLLAQYLTLRAQALAAKRDCDGAIADYNEAIRLRENWLRSTGKTDEFPFNIEAYYAGRAGVWSRCKREFDKAIADFDETIRQAELNWPKFNRENPKSTMLDRRYMYYLDRGTAWFDAMDFDRAIVDFDESLRLVPKGESYNKRAAGIVNNRAHAWRRKGSYDQAIADFGRALGWDPGSSRYYSGRGDIWRLKGDLTRALADQDKAIALGAKNEEALSYTRRGDAYRYRGDFTRALADYEKALSYDRKYAWALTGRGLTYERMGNIAQARAEFQKAIASSGDYEPLEAARARLAALESGEAPPVIPAVPAKAANVNSLPTPVIAAPILAKPLAPERLQTTAVRQGRRVALIIGNSAYREAPALANPKNDIAAVATSLRNIGFESVSVAPDKSREELIRALRTFAEEADKADWAMVYYAGHGIEVNGQNYLIPVDATLKTDRDVQFEAVAMDQVMSSIDGAKTLKLIVLDACRDNPFAPKMEKTGVREVAAVQSTAAGTVGTRSIGRGLGEVKVTGASLVVFAAKHGQTALDGEGANSPFAVALVQRIATPGVEINKIFRLVRDDVMEATAGRQEPYTYGSLPGKEDFFFVEAK